ncbi:MAG: phenylalanyl-tRNA synthetase beta chain [Hyphomicrobiaceae bacterium]|jgi:phenylalanyl-tRNA synthetase beta chain
MRLPLSWLADYISDLPDPEQISERLTMAGLEVEALERGAIEGMVDTLVVARLEETTPHPNADRLTLCRVNDGEGERQIVCGARNMKAGDLVVLARPGTVLPAGHKIKKGKLRGEESAGMLCSSEELGLPPGEDGILVIGDGDEFSPGTAAVPLLGLDDTILEIAITPNRGDCLSVRGLAREVAAVCELQTTPAWTSGHLLPTEPSAIPVFIEEPAGCSMYRGVQVRGVTIALSPAWLRRRLAASGVRSINNVVDVTNYVLLEYGQPLHAFDCARLAGPSIFVRAAGDTATMETLDGTTVELRPDDLVIADEAGPIALAGVMGGAASAVSPETTDLFLEAAVFDPNRIRRTSRRLGLITDSSYRFERGIDSGALPEALARAASLIARLGGGTVVESVTAAGDGPPRREPIVVRPARVSEILATPVERDEISALLSRLGVTVSIKGDDLLVEPPSHRHDLDREIDFVEEVARLRGYDNVGTELPRISMAPQTLPPAVHASRVVRRALLADGLNECVGLAFASDRSNALLPGLHPVGASAVCLRNPLRSDESQMRRSGLPHLLEAHLLNRRNGRRTTDFFTVARTFARQNETVNEREVFAGLLAGPRRLRAPGDGGEATFWDAKGVVERAVATLAPTLELSWVPESGRPEYHPRECAAVKVGNAVVGYVGILHPDVAEELEIVEKIALFEVDSLLVLEYAPAHAGLEATGKFPSSSRDVSFLVPRDMLAGQVIDTIRSLDEQLIESVCVFDEYTGEGVGTKDKALAFQVIYRASDRTLTDDEVARLQATVVDTVTQSLNLRVRT